MWVYEYVSIDVWCTSKSMLIKVQSEQMGFQQFFKACDSVCISYLSRKRVPDAGGVCWEWSISKGF